MGMNPNKMHSIPFKKYISKKKENNNNKEKINNNNENEKQQAEQKNEENYQNCFYKAWIKGIKKYY